MLRGADRIGDGAEEFGAVIPRPRPGGAEFVYKTGMNLD